MSGQYGQNMNGMFRNTMPGANSSSAPWWANTMNTMGSQASQRQAQPFAAGPALRAGQPMNFNPSMFQQNASGPVIQPVPLPQNNAMPPAFGSQPVPGFGAPQLSTTQYIQNVQAQRAAEAAQAAAPRVSYGFVEGN